MIRRRHQRSIRVWQAKQRVVLARMQGQELSQVSAS